MLRIAIRRVNGVAVFEPNPATTSVAQDGGSFIFENYDTDEHQPAPDDTTLLGVWFPDPIAAGSPPEATPSILNTIKPANLNPAQPLPFTCPYHCELDTDLTGSIIFTP